MEIYNYLVFLENLLNIQFMVEWQGLKGRNERASVIAAERN